MTPLAIRLLVFVPILLLGATLSAFGLVTVCLSLNRPAGLIFFAPGVPLGGLMICLSLAAAVALRRADTTVGGFFEERACDRS